MKKLIALTLLVVSFTGCVPKMIMNRFEQEDYSKYVQETNRLNLEREKSGLPREQVMTYQEWSGKK